MRIEKQIRIAEEDFMSQKFQENLRRWEEKTLKRLKMMMAVVCLMFVVTCVTTHAANKDFKFSLTCWKKWKR